MSLSKNKKAVAISLKLETIKMLDDIIKETNVNRKAKKLTKSDFIETAIFYFIASMIDKHNKEEK